MAIDEATRLAYAEVLGGRTSDDGAGFLRRAGAFIAATVSRSRR